MKFFFYVMLGLLICTNSEAKKLKVLFIGNSYTDVNNLPEIIKQLANSMSDTLIYQKSVPGGYTFQNHTTNATTINLIQQGGWDAVVLQEQSQFPSFPIDQVETMVFPYAKKLDSLIHVSSPCAKTVFYMTWGRKNGDEQNCPQWPPVCSYQGMDSLLQSRYTMMAESNHSWISPVAKVWRHLREMTTPIELYQADESHPSPAGSYAAALSFYAVLFGKDATSSNYNFSVNANDAAVIRNVVKTIVYDSLPHWRQYNTTALVASFTYTNSANTFTFVSNSTGNPITGYKWNFGDGSPEINTPTASHIFTSAGTHQVCLTVSNTCGEDVYCTSVNNGTVGINEIEKKEIVIFPNPVIDVIRFNYLKDNYQYSIYDSKGIKVKSGSVSPGIPIMVEDLAKGVYFIGLTDRNFVKSIFKIRKS